MPVIAIGILATAAIGGGGYYAWRKTHPKDGAAGAEGAEGGAQPGWRQRLASVRGGAATEGEGATEGGSADGKDAKTKDGKEKKKSRFGMPKMPKVKIPSASEVKVMVAKKQMGL